MSESQSQTPGWIWLLSGLVIGLFIAFLVYVKNKNESLLASDRNSQPVQATISPDSNNPPTEPPTKFEFYKLLPQDGSPDRPAAEQQPRAATQVEKQVAQAPAEPKSLTLTEPGNYLLQVGSFRRYEDADTLKAKLAFSGIVADIASVTLANGQEWHRVRIGPSNDMAFITDMQARLRASDFSAMIMKAPKQ